MKNNFRELTPTRTCTKTFSKYTAYKLHLAKDFNNRCGYTDCSDFWFGGRNNFHIDHFIPWKKHPENPGLKLSYANLVYVCSYVNISKSDDEGDYMDPCNTDFNLHFERDEFGNILPLAASKEANYMHRKLKLYLKRYQIIWMLENIESKMNRIQSAIDKIKDEKLKADLVVLQAGLAAHMLQYLKYLRAEQ